MNLTLPHHSLARRSDFELRLRKQSRKPRLYSNSQSLFLSSVHTHHSSKTLSTHSLRVLLRKDTVLSLSIVLLLSRSSLLQDQNPTEKDIAGRIYFLVTQTATLSPEDLSNQRRIWSTDGMLMNLLCHRHLLLSDHIHTKQMRRTTNGRLCICHRISALPLLVQVERRALLRTSFTGLRT